MYSRVNRVVCILDILRRQSATTVAAKISISLLQFRTFTGLCMMAFVLALQCAHPLIWVTMTT